MTDSRTPPENPDLPPEHPPQHGHAQHRQDIEQYRRNRDGKRHDLLQYLADSAVKLSDANNGIIFHGGPVSVITLGYSHDLDRVKLTSKTSFDGRRWNKYGTEVIAETGIGEDSTIHGGDFFPSQEVPRQYRRHASSQHRQEAKRLFRDLVPDFDLRDQYTLPHTLTLKEELEHHSDFPDYLVIPESID